MKKYNISNEKSKGDREDISSSDSVFDKIAQHQWENIVDKEVDQTIGLRAWNKIEQRVRHKKISLFDYAKYIAGIAACIILVLIAVPYFQGSKDSEDAFSEYTTLYFIESSFITLPDSSQIWIQPNTTVKFSNDFTKRIVWIEGNALFDVVKTVDKTPFRVYTDLDTYVEVKGTTFSVRSIDEINTVVLHSGEVDFVVKSMDETVNLQENQKVIYNRETSSLHKEGVDMPPLENGAFKFKDIKLEYLLGYIENIYSCEIVFKNALNRDYKFTGSFKFTESLPNVLEKISYTFDLKYEQLANTNQILIN